MITKAEAVAWLLGDVCADCGARLDAPGTPCPQCGMIPAVTAPEAAETLDGPVALASVEAARIRAGAWAALDAAIESHRQADRAMHVAVLQVRRDQAQVALDEHLAAHKTLFGPQKAARRAEREAAERLAAASRDHADYARAEEIARRMRHGLRAETDAAQALAAAGDVLARYKQDLAAAAAAREAAENAVTQSAHRAETLELARDRAVAAVTDPGRTPLGPETIAAGLVRLLLRGELDEVETVIAGQLGRMLCGLTGATEDIVAEARHGLLEEQERDRREQPVVLRQAQPGAPLPVVGNPGAPGVPSQRGVGPIGDGVLRTPGLGGI